MTDRLPPLQFENCDVIVKLSADHNRHLLVHSDVIRAGFPTLGPASKPQWNIPETIKHPLTGKQIDVYRLALKSVEHTILLEGKEEVVDPAKGRVFNHEIAEMAVITLSYAKYYGGLERIAPILFRQFESYGQSFWEDVALRPKFYIMLATKTQNSELYSESLRHLITQKRPQERRVMHYTPAHERTRVNDIDRRSAPEVLGMTPDEYSKRFQPRLDELDPTLRLLEIQLLQLQLHTYEYWYDRFRKRASTSLLDLLSANERTFPHHTADLKAAERYDFLARSLWGQWLVQQLAGQKVYATGMGNGRAEPGGPFNTTCRKIVEAAASEDPSSIIGYKCASRLSSLFRLGSEYQPERRVQFRLGSEYQPEQRVKKILDEVVREAASRIEYAFFPSRNRIETGPEGQKTEDFVTWRQCRYAEVGKNFTYLAVRDSDLPWEWEWDEPSALPEVDRAEASEKWLEAVGLVDDVLPMSWQELFAS
ncbi:hypothetical protein KC340_g17532 [Hortaea werneckii]|nr:hypothetical protein KC342_g14766 [Hortaea werneckii]KAI7107277.1 hypothetical protein KC339_g2506 [Hortaea werneckii]KAI7206840.1 hypothetical protein KC365_g16922 [Hortaea werneckii]KAI7290017.1 hypothetical protein KC340_g17532 [Hortaea werneckii]KAI7407451.1 hypothetical protein KC328_g517 [Hortaea werneckii]